MKVQTKKTVKIFVVTFIALFFSSSSSAASNGSIVIIDSYFDARIPNATIVCIATDKCINVAKLSTKVSDAVNHGTAMAEVARRNNPNVPLVLLRSANVDKKGAVGILNGNNFLAALKWADANSLTVSAVSFSYNLSGNMSKPGDCKLSPTGLVDINKTDPAIRATILNLNSKGIPVFVSTDLQFFRLLLKPSGG